MTRAVATLALILTVLAACPSASAAPKREQKRAYKPAERRQQAAEAQPSQASDPAADGAAPAAGYEAELQAAKEKRDQQLSDASTAETDQRKLEKKKQEIFAQYAAIVAALRDKYEAAHADDAAAPPPAGKNRPRAKAGSGKGNTADADEDAPAGKKRNAKGRGSADALADAQEKLAEENARHAAKMEQLNAQLAQAESSDSLREVRRVQKAIDKENNSYNARKAILERRVHDLGGTVPPPPAPAAAQP